MYSFTSGTIVSARTSSPSMPGTQPVSSNISLAVSRRALTSLVVALLMIGSPVLVQLDLHVLLPEGRPHLLPVNIAEQRDELRPFHSITSSARARSVGDSARPSAMAVLRLNAV